MSSKIDYYYNDIDIMFQNLENKDFRNEISILYTYDKRCTDLFSEVGKREKYYRYKSEIEAAEVAAKALSKKVGPKALFFEYGSGNCAKSKPFLKHLKNLTGFVALDIDRNILEKAEGDIKNEFPNIDMHIIIDDFFTEDFNLPKKFDEHKMKVFYMSCNLINLFKRELVPIFFQHISKFMKKGDLLIIAIDSLKDIERANELCEDIYYEKFIMNILHRLNNEFNGNFDEDNFEYSYRISQKDEYSYYDLKSKHDHEVKINNKTYKVLEGKIIRVVNNKYNYNTIKENGLKVGLKTFDCWTDNDGLMMNIGLEKGI